MLLRTLFIVALVASLSACGPTEVTPDALEADSVAASATAADASVPVDTVRVTLYSYRYEVERDTFVAGRPYHFVLENRSAIAHEWAIVPRGATDESALLLEVEADDLPAGSTYAVTFAFPEAGSYDFACYMEAPANHYDMGMVYPVEVVAGNS